MSDAYDPHRPPASGEGFAQHNFGEHGRGGQSPHDAQPPRDGRARQNFGEGGAHADQLERGEASGQPPSGAAPIVWNSPGDAQPQNDRLPWSGPDPFAAPPARPAAPAHLPPPHEPEHRPDPVQQPQPVPPSLEKPQQPAAEPARANATSQDNHDDSDEEALTIGRGRGNSIVLDDMLVSRHHVRITADDDGLVLQDLGSRNGTYVNGQRVERTALHEGDRLGIGATTFEVRDGWLVSV